MTKLYLKTIYSTRTSKLIIFLSPILVAIALSALFTPYFQVGAGQVFTTSLSSGTIWGMTYFSMRKTTLYENLKGTRTSRYIMYFSIFLSMIIVTFCSQILYWTTIIFLDKIGFTSLLSHFYDQDGYKMNWLNVDWATILYTWFLSVILMFLGCFTTRNFFKTEKTFFAILICYIFYLVGFGGLFPPKIDGSNGYIIYTNSVNPLLRTLQFSMPQYSINMFNYSALASGFEKVDGTTLNNISNFESFKWSEDWKWNFVILYPFFIFILLGSLSIFTIEFYN